LFKIKYIPNVFWPLLKYFDLQEILQVVFHVKTVWHSPNSNIHIFGRSGIAGMQLVNTIFFLVLQNCPIRTKYLFAKVFWMVVFFPERLQTRVETKPWEQVLYLIHPTQLADVLSECILLCNEDTKSYFYTTRFLIRITNIMYMNMLNGRVGSFKYHKWQQMEHYRKFYFMVCNGETKFYFLCNKITYVIYTGPS
jgi:hypothetical protein